jgi:FMN phosphatase YigB (HAD superfamily)
MQRAPIVFLFDVDNTLLDNDRVSADLRKHLEIRQGSERANRYWQHFEALRAELGYADYLGALQRYRMEFPREPELIEVSTWLVDYPFANRLFPNSLDAVEHVKRFGTPAILSDGDIVFQPRKVERSGLRDAVGGNVLIFVHKEEELEEVERRFPAEHYVMIDDKLRLLDAIKRHWKKRVTTVFPRQGHYALDAKNIAKYPAADLTIERIGELVNFGLDELLAAR